MATITVVMFPIETVPAKHYAAPIFVRDNGLKLHTHWDEIHAWVAGGHTVTIRPPTPEELKTMQPEIDAFRASRAG